MAATLESPLLANKAAAGDDAYSISKSIRFDDAGDAHLRRSNINKGNTRVWTFSGWFKLTDIADGNNSSVFSAGDQPWNSNGMAIAVYLNQLWVSQYNGGSYDWDLRSTRKFRDYSAWYHVCVACDTEQATASDRIKVYINGERVTQWSTETYPSQNFETYVNNNAKPQFVGVNSSTKSIDGNIAEPQLIDGLALSPAAFGAFDSNTGVWQPKAFAIPTPNDGTTWSGSGFSGDAIDSSNPATNLFDGKTNTYFYSNAQAATIHWEPSGGIKYNQSIEIHASFNGTCSVNDGETVIATDGSGSLFWHKVVEGSGTLDKLSFTSVGTHKVYMTGIRVDGVILVDGQTDKTFDQWKVSEPMNSGVLRSGEVTYESGSHYGSNDGTKLFNGLTTGGADDASSGNWVKWTPASPVSFSSKVETWVYGESGPTNTLSLKRVGVGSTDDVSCATAEWHTLYTGSGEIEYIKNQANSGYNNWRAIRVDGVILTDWGLNTNSFHLKFDDTAADRTLGHSQLMNTPTGAQPMYGPGADDSAKSSLVLALPGYDLNDHSATIKGSGSNKTVTASGAVVNSAGQAKFYGNCLEFNDDGSNDVLSIANNEDLCDFGSGNFTMEAWIKPTKVNDSMFLMGCSKNASNPNRRGPMLFISQSSDNEIRFEYSTGGTHSAYINDGLGGAPQDRWTHVAVVRNGNNCKLYLNGKQEGSTLDVSSISTAADNNDDPFTIGHNADQTWGAFDGYMQDVRVYKGAAKYTANFTPPIRNDYTPLNINTTAPAQLGYASAIYKTNANGSTKDSPEAFHSDPNSDKLVLAIPGDEIADHSADVHGSGSNLSITNQSASIVTSHSKYYGSSLKLSAGSGYISNVDLSSIDTDNDWTVEFWCYEYDQPEQGYAQIINVGTGGSYLGYYDNSGNQTWEFYFGGGTKYKTVTTSTLMTDSWKHVSLQHSSGTVEVYIDGTKVGSTTGFTGDNTWSSTCQIGNYGGQGMNCYINDLRVYNNLRKYTADFTPAVAPVNLPEGIDTSVDTPTNGGEDEGAGGEVTGNYCVLNAADNGGVIVKQGGLQVSHNAGSWKGIRGTWGITSGKWYFEVTLRGQAPDSNNGYYVGVGTKDASLTNVLQSGQYIRQNTIRWSHDTNTSFWGQVAVNVVHGIAIDMDNKEMWISHDNTWQSNGDPETRANPHYTLESDHDEVFPLFHVYGSNIKLELNFGARAYKYTAPSGYKSLCTQNLPDTFSGEDADTVNNPSKFFKTILWQDNNKTLKLPFSPDLVVQKERDGDRSHGWYDRIRGAGTLLDSANDNAEAAEPQGLTAFNSDGFTVGTHSSVDDSQVAWCWDAGTAEITPSDSYDITPSEQWVNTTAGFSITEFTLTGSSSISVPHALGAKPDFLLIKRLDAAGNWYVYTDIIDGSYDYAFLNLTSAFSNSIRTIYDNVKFYSTTTAGDYIAYAWAGIPGYSKFGIYSGNASADGPYVYTGFRPSFIAIKRESGTGDWTLIDGQRDKYNVGKHLLAWDSYAEENSTHGQEIIDILGNGFKLRQASSDYRNQTGSTYIYAAWAEHPFKTSRAR